MAVLTAKQIAQYWDEGYLVVPNLLTEEEVEFFLKHSGKPLEPNLGLANHTLHPHFKMVANHPKVAGGAAELLGGKPYIVQTMYMDKPAEGGRGIAPHQDVHYLRNEPNTLMACWVAMNDTDPENGGLCVVPGSHKQGLRSAHKNANLSDHDTWEAEYPMRDKDGREYLERMYSFEIDNLDPATVRRLTVPKGAGVYFTGLTIHGSYANTSNRPRKAFATHYVKEGTFLPRVDVQKTVPVELVGV